MGKTGFEQLLGVHAAPMLMGLKAASLLSFQKSRFEDFDALLDSYQNCFTCKGISIYRLSEGEEYVLILFYRASTLWRQLQQPKAQVILADCGYQPSGRLMDQLRYLQLRMRLQKSFPHEIGLFLGYPPDDVAGFITYKGKQFCYSGYWKVYANEQETRALFDLYADCTEKFCTRLKDGAYLSDLVQAL